MAPASISTTTATHGSTPTIISGSPYKDKMIASFNIPVELTEHKVIPFFNILVKLTDHKDINLGFAWQKYKACLEAIKTCNLLWESKELRDIFDRKPTQADIIGLFKGKAQWHSTYAKAFPKSVLYTSPQILSAGSPLGVHWSFKLVSKNENCLHP